MKFKLSCAQCPHLTTNSFHFTFNCSEASGGKPPGSFFRGGGGHNACRTGTECYRLRGGLGFGGRGGLYDRAGLCGGAGSGRRGGPIPSACSHSLDAGSEEEEHRKKTQIVTIEPQK